MKLYDYQKNIITQLKQAIQSGSRSPVIVLPCGGGKSIICADIAYNATAKNNNVLFLVHRIELVEQIKNTFSAYGVNMNLCDISMVQSAKKLPHKDYKIIITDESHHSTCRTYTTIYNEYPEALRINVTATPCRMDGRGLGETCDKLINTVSVKWLINNEYLAKYIYYSINIANISNIKKIRGEYEDTTDLFDKPKVYGDMLKYYTAGDKVICYCSSIRHSINTAQEFNNIGIPAAHIDGNTEPKERENIINKFRQGEIMVLCNYALISEGFDVPDCNTVFLLRKTASLNLYIQMSMRCMRYRSGKIAKIYDFCGNCYEHGLPDDDREWTLDSTIKIQKNATGEPDILCRQCKSCYRVYAGTNKICPYCGHDNGKTKKEIEIDKKAELERIEKIKKIEYKKDLKEANKSLESLIAFGKEHNYKPGWAYYRYKLLQKYGRK